MFSIIIPFHQTSFGVLTRALESIFAQTDPDWRVIIIDDESPVKAEDVVAQVPAHFRERIYVERVTNGGPGKARNIALDRVCAMEDADKIAFLDSDDRWHPTHLERANQALAVGDVYFCDYTWLNTKSSRFKESGLCDKTYASSIGDGLIRRLQGDFSELILECWPVHLSGVCINKNLMGKLRFDDRFKYSSEDQHYFLQLADKSSKIYYDCHLGVHLDEGEKFYANRKRGQLKYTRSCITNLLFHYAIRDEFKLSPRARLVNRRHATGNIKEIVISEGKSFMQHRKLHFELYPYLFKVLWYGLGTL